MSTEKVAKLSLQRDYKKFLFYYINGDGNVAAKEKGHPDKPATVVAKTGITRDNNYLYYLDKDGDVSRSPKAKRGTKA